jgi:hypothetical protein
MVLAGIAICFAASAVGLGARHGCSAQGAAAERLAHHHDGGSHKGTPATPLGAQCDCVGHACCLAPVASPSPGLAVAAAIEESAPLIPIQGYGPRSDSPHLLPYATAPPFLLTA